MRLSGFSKRDTTENASFVFVFAVLVIVATAGRRDLPAAGSDPDIARWHDGGNGVLVNHLADRIAQQHDELVEAFYRALQLDAVHQVDGDGYALATQRIKERVLQ